jgi:hypothetical protein
MPKEKTPETKLKLACTKAIKQFGGYSLPIPGGAYGKAGAPDRIIFFRGEAIACEFKSPTGKLGPKQIEVQRMIEAAGCKYLVVRNLDDLYAGLGIKTLLGGL